MSDYPGSDRGWQPGDPPDPFLVRAADRLYAECERAIQAGRLDARSPIADAALDYRDIRDDMTRSPGDPAVKPLIPVEFLDHPPDRPFKSVSLMEHPLPPRIRVALHRQARGVYDIIAPDQPRQKDLWQIVEYDRVGDENDGRYRMAADDPPDDGLFVWACPECSRQETSYRYDRSRPSATFCMHHEDEPDRDERPQHVRVPVVPRGALERLRAERDEARGALEDARPTMRNLHATATIYSAALRAIAGPTTDGSLFIDAYRQAGGGYAGLQAIAEHALTEAIGLADCARCAHPAGWHRLASDAAIQDPTDPNAQFRCLGYDCTADGPPPAGGRACDCPNYEPRR